MTKEFFWCGMQALYAGKYNGQLPYFEGSQDYKLPSADPILLRSGVFNLIGRFMLHSAIHMGLAFVGMSNAIVEYLMLDTVGPDTPINITINDLPDHEVRIAVQAVSSNCSKISKVLI